MMKKRIVVDPPVSEARRDRVERQLFAQLAAVRIHDRADAVIPRVRRRRLAIGLAFAAAAAAVLFLITRGGGDRGGTEQSPSRVVTLPGNSSQFTVPGAVIITESDTIIEWRQGADGSITIELERGAVDCD